MIAISEPYRPRKITCLELWRFETWRLKIYAISYTGAPLRPMLISAAKKAALDVLVNAPFGHHAVGFIGIHAGKTRNLVSISWWANETELHHRVFTSSHERPMELENAADSGASASVWDLAVLGFERTAWIETVLSKDPADVDGYLARRLGVLATLRRPLQAVESRRTQLRLD